MRLNLLLIVCLLSIAGCAVPSRLSLYRVADRTHYELDVQTATYRVDQQNVYLSILAATRQQNSRDSWVKITFCATSPLDSPGRLHTRIELRRAFESTCRDGTSQFMYATNAQSIARLSGAVVLDDHFSPAVLLVDGIDLRFDPNTSDDCQCASYEL